MKWAATTSSKNIWTPTSRRRVSRTTKKARCFARPSEGGPSGEPVEAGAQVSASTPLFFSSFTPMSPRSACASSESDGSCPTSASGPGSSAAEDATTGEWPHLLNVLIGIPLLGSVAVLFLPRQSPKLLTGFTLGLLESVTILTLGTDVRAVGFVALFVMLILRPSGLLGRQTSERV